jgi:hypothetical protein
MRFDDLVEFQQSSAERTANGRAHKLPVAG